MLNAINAGLTMSLTKEHFFGTKVDGVCLRRGAVTVINVLVEAFTWQGPLSKQRTMRAPTLETQ